MSSKIHVTDLESAINWWRERSPSPDGISAAPEVRALAEAYALLGLKLGFDNGGPVSAYIEGRNLTNKAYISSTSIINQATATSPLFEPGNGRAVFAGMKYRW